VSIGQTSGCTIVLKIEMDEYSIWTLLEKYNKKIEKSDKLRTQQRAKEEIKETESTKPLIKIYGLLNGAIVEETIIERTPNGGAYSKVRYMSGGGLPVDKSVAKKMFCMEFDEDGHMINHLLLTCT